MSDTLDRLRAAARAEEPAVTSEDRIRLLTARVADELCTLNFVVREALVVMGCPSAEAPGDVASDGRMTWVPLEDVIQYHVDALAAQVGMPAPACTRLRAALAACGSVPTEHLKPAALPDALNALDKIAEHVEHALRLSASEPVRADLRAAMEVLQAAGAVTEAGR